MQGQSGKFWVLRLDPQNSAKWKLQKSAEYIYKAEINVPSYNNSMYLNFL